MDGLGSRPAETFPRKKSKRADLHQCRRLWAMEKKVKKRTEDRMVL
jgi:hypothetical protein